MEARSSHGCPYSDHQNRSLSAAPSQESDVHLVNTMLSSTKLALLLDFSKIQITEPKFRKSLSDDRISKMTIKPPGKGLTFSLPPCERKKGKDEQCENINRWINRMCIFFVNTFFQAYRHEETLKEKIEENKLHYTAMAKRRKTESDELEARLLMLELKEEEVKRQDHHMVDITVIKEPVDIPSLHAMLGLPKEAQVLGLSKSFISKKKKK
ncbi:Radial spoke head 10 like protein B [Myotis brandtii]|uniref:Radial spoke head 10 like protein B n=1 Tax=Myotis brandtii TaxID=109478 RepID=S7NHA4_MYOBR|nr:Radial spoke head 10 like protein B [Myotis brandtii]